MLEKLLAAVAKKCRVTESDFGQPRLSHAPELWVRSLELKR